MGNCGRKDMKWMRGIQSMPGNLRHKTGLGTPERPTGNTDSVRVPRGENSTHNSKASVHKGKWTGWQEETLRGKCLKICQRIENKS